MKTKLIHAKGLVKDYFTKEINYGGIMTPRHEIIKHLQSLHFSNKDIDYYLFCLDQNQEVAQ